MARYPELQPALPASYVKPSRTSRILQPGIVLVTVILLGSMSLVGIVVAASILSSGSSRTTSMEATQGFALIAAILSITYILLHAIAAKNNEEVGVVRPPELRLHAACFILARMSLVFWIVTFITAWVVLSRPKMCLKGTRDCHLQVAHLVASIVAIFATCIILTALEACKYPFQMPDFLHLTKTITVRVSSFGDDLFDRSVSRTSSFNENEFRRKEKSTGVTHKPNTNNKPLPERGSDSSEPERPLTPLLPMPRGTASRGWGEEWTHSGKDREPEKKAVSNSDSGISLSYDSSSGYISSSEGSSHGSPKNSSSRRSHVSPTRRSPASRRPPRPKIVTPSSSISNLTRRSPLSTMRYAESPDVVVRPDLRYCPPLIPPPHEWNASRTASISQLLPIADVPSLHGGSSGTVPDPFISPESKDLPPLPKPTTPATRRKPSHLRGYGSFIDHLPAFEIEQSLEDHMMKIEVEYVRRRASMQDLQPKLSTHSVQPRSSIYDLQSRASLRSLQAREAPQDLLSRRGMQILQPQPSYSLQYKPLARLPAISPGYGSPSQASSRSRLSLLGDPEKRISPMRVDSKSKYPGYGPIVHRSQSAAVLKQARPTKSESNIKQKKKSVLEKEEPFRRLSLGDISPGLGKLF